MKKLTAKLIRVLIAIVAVIALSVLSVKAVRYGTKVATFNYVKSNTQQLTAEAERVIAEGVFAQHQFDGKNLTYYPSSPNPVVEFSTGGFGIAPSGYYTGFYYSPEDVPVRYNGHGTAMEEYKNGWAYADRGDNHGYTEKICDNWYWYKFWF